MDKHPQKSIVMSEYSLQHGRRASVLSKDVIKRVFIKRA